MKWSMTQIEEWRTVNKKKMQAQGGIRMNNQHHNQKWVRPGVGKFKVNVDASVKQNQNSFVVGMVLRNHQGHYITGKTMRIMGSVQVVKAEVTAIFEALKWLEELPVAEVIIESDSLLGVKAITQNYTNYMNYMLGTLVQQCKELITTRGGISIEFVRKRANKVAHELAKFPCEPNSFIVISSPPYYLLETIMLDALINE